MTITVQEIQAIESDKFSAKLNRYDDTAGPVHWYVLDGKTAAGAPFQLILTPESFIDHNPLKWADGYRTLLGSLVGHAL